MSVSARMIREHYDGHSVLYLRRNGQAAQVVGLMFSYAICMLGEERVAVPLDMLTIYPRMIFASS